MFLQIFVKIFNDILISFTTAT